MRGLPGSGKSTKVNKLLEKYGGNKFINVFSTDDFNIPITRQLQIGVNIDFKGVAEKIFNLFNDYYSPATITFNKVKRLVNKFFELYKKNDFQGCIDLVKKNILDFELFEYRSRYNHISTSYFHDRNFENFKNAVDQEISPIIVDNTNIKYIFFERYVSYAESNGYEIKIEEPDSDLWVKNRSLLSNFNKNKKKLDQLADELFLRNKHGVSKETILDMMAKWQDKNPKIKN